MGILPLRWSINKLAQCLLSGDIFCYNNRVPKKFKMKYKVQLWVGGKTWWFECYANNLNEAKQVAMAQHPNARIVTATATFLWCFQIFQTPGFWKVFHPDQRVMWLKTESGLPFLLGISLSLFVMENKFMSLTILRVQRTTFLKKSNKLQEKERHHQLLINTCND